jgi:uncharacterized membrane protein YfcA
MPSLAGTNGTAVLFTTGGAVNHPVLQVLFFCCAAFIPSLLGAMSGIGGGIIIKPVLDAVYPGGPEEVNFLSGCTVLAMSFVSLVQRRLAGGRLEDRRGIALALGAVLGGLAGKTFFSLLLSGAGDGREVRITQSGILLGLTVLVLISTLHKDKQISRNINNRFLSILIGCALGLLSSFLGIGGGPVNIMALSFFLGMDTKTAALYSLLTIFCSQSASFAQSLFQGNIPAVPPSALAVMVAGGILGGLAGSRMLRKTNNRQVDTLFRWILVLIILISLYNVARFTVLPFSAYH